MSRTDSGERKRRERKEGRGEEGGVHSTVCFTHSLTGVSFPPRNVRLSNRERERESERERERGREGGREKERDAG